MVNQKMALSRLNKERDYEDGLVQKLGDYFLSVLDNVEGLSEVEKAKIRKYLTSIMNDSERHSQMFIELAQMVFESGEKDY
jgi:hypothetical protein